MPVIEVDSIEHAQQELRQIQGAIVVVPVYNAFDDCLACFESLLRHTNSNVAILVVDDAGGDTRALNHLKDATTVGSLAARRGVSSTITGITVPRRHCPAQKSTG